MAGTKYFLRASLYIFFGARMSRLSADCSPSKAVLGSRWSSIRNTWTAIFNCEFNRMYSILENSASYRTSTFVIVSSLNDMEDTKTVVTGTLKKFHVIAIKETQLCIHS